MSAWLQGPCWIRGAASTLTVQRPERHHCHVIIKIPGWGQDLVCVRACMRACVLSTSSYLTMDGALPGHTAWGGLTYTTPWPWPWALQPTLSSHSSWTWQDAWTPVPGQIGKGKQKGGLNILQRQQKIKQTESTLLSAVFWRFLPGVTHSPADTRSPPWES